jgi:hypothetical protein
VGGPDTLFHTAAVSQHRLPLCFSQKLVVLLDLLLGQLSIAHLHLANGRIRALEALLTPSYAPTGLNRSDQTVEFFRDLLSDCVLQFQSRKLSCLKCGTAKESCQCSRINLILGKHKRKECP